MEQPLIVTSAIIVNEKNELLLVKRAREPFKDYWGFIGGKGAFKFTKDPIEAVKIEVKGDIGCDFEPKFFTYNFENFGIPTLTLFYYGEIKGELRITERYISEFKWFNPEEANKVDLCFDNKKILKMWIENKSH